MQTAPIRLGAFPVRGVLPLLLQDKTTRRNLLWATESYADLGADYAPEAWITEASLEKMEEGLLQPRVLKTLARQQERTRTHAEVFTPSWVCNKMNNFCDAEWFGRGEVFNREGDRAWEACAEPVAFPEKDVKVPLWQRYVDSRRLEITCGEAPFVVSRYDAATGEQIPIPQRIGLLDRKLRVVNENTLDEAAWLKWTFRAFQSVYGYEFQGDNLLIARVNLLLTFVEYLFDRWHREPTLRELKKLANIIAWNFFQMDGLKGTVPLGEPEEEQRQIGFDDLFDLDAGSKPSAPQGKKTPRCRIFDWRTNESLLFENVGKERTRHDRLSRKHGCCALS